MVSWEGWGRGRRRGLTPLPPPAVLPTASVLPPSQVVYLNHSANLTCVATGRPPPQVSWLHNGVPIEGTSPGVTVTPSSLVIAMVMGGDAGVYTCSADNDVGRAIAMATVTVLCELLLSCPRCVCAVLLPLLLVSSSRSPTRPAHFCHLSSSVGIFHWCDMVPWRRWGLPHYRLFRGVPAFTRWSTHLSTHFHGDHLPYAEWPRPLQGVQCSSVCRQRCRTEPAQQHRH